MGGTPRPCPPAPTEVESLSPFEAIDVLRYDLRLPGATKDAASRNWTKAKPQVPASPLTNTFDRLDDRQTGRVLELAVQQVEEVYGIRIDPTDIHPDLDINDVIVAVEEAALTLITSYRELVSQPEPEIWWPD